MWKYLYQGWKKQNHQGKPSLYHDIRIKCFWSEETERCVSILRKWWIFPILKKGGKKGFQRDQWVADEIIFSYLAEDFNFFQKLGHNEETKLPSTVQQKLKSYFTALVMKMKNLHSFTWQCFTHMFLNLSCILMVISGVNHWDLQTPKMLSPQLLYMIPSHSWRLWREWQVHVFRKNHLPKSWSINS